MVPWSPACEMNGGRSKFFGGILVFVLKHVGRQIDDPIA